MVAMIKDVIPVQPNTQGNKLNGIKMKEYKAIKYAEFFDFPNLEGSRANPPAL